MALLPFALAGGFLLLLSTGSSTRRRPAVLAAGQGDWKARWDEYLAGLVADEPTPGKFYQAQADEHPRDIARTALGLSSDEKDDEQVAAFWHTVASGPRWNARLYGSSSTSRKFPSEYLTPVKKLGVRAAFRGVNDDALAALLDSTMPKRGLDEIGKPLEGFESLGLLWIPPVARTESGVFVSQPHWPDGSTTLDPPPEFWSGLR